MSGLNKAMIIGNLGSDPEVRSTSSGTRVATLSVATNRRWTGRDGNEREDVAWHRIILWERMAEVAEEYLSTGDRIYVEGRIEYREWEGDDGQTRYTTEIVAKRLLMLGLPSGGRSRRPEPAPAGGDGGEGGEFSEESLTGSQDDDLPF